MHPRLKELPAPDRENDEWHAFVANISAEGPENVPAILVTPEGLIMDGARRWMAAKQLGWDTLRVIYRPESEAASIIVCTLLGHKHLTKGAKVYLIVPLLHEFVEAAERRRLANLRQGRKTLEKALIFPKSVESTSEKGVGDICERLGCKRDTFFQAVKVRRIFSLSSGHKFEFQDGSTKTLKQHFEPRLLDSEHPMGLGEVLKGCGWFVGEDGKPKTQQGPGERNSHLHYFESAWAKLNGQFAGRWEKLGAAGRARAVELVRTGVREWPEEVREEIGAAIREAKRK